LPDPPSAIKVETSRLSFHLSPMTTKGLLSAQVKDALNALRKDMHGATMVKLRAFVAGRGDTRRVAAIVSEVFSEWHQPLPALSVIQVGALPVVGAQVWVEALAEERKPVNMHGVEWLDGVEVTRPLSEGGDVAEVKPLLEEALGALKGEMLSVTCFVSSIDGVAGLEAAMAAKFPAATRTLVQAQRATGSGLAHCEGVARATSGEAERIVMTGTQIGFGREKADVEAAEKRLERLMEAQGAKLSKKRSYAVTRSLSQMLGVVTVVEGVGAAEGSFAWEAWGK
jgi:enamine deaminase RidA (YjgF/YER057c/UK114 family)